MGRCNAILRLPADVRAEVNARLAASNFTGYERLSEWLKAEGSDISTSSVHRYGQSIEAKTPVPEAPFSDSAELRIRCAESASAFYSDGDLVRLSEALYNWVITGKT